MNMGPDGNKFAITEVEYTERRRRVQQAMEREQLDALIAYSNAKVQANVRYLTSYFVRFAGMQTRTDGSYYQFGSTLCLMPGDDISPAVRTDQPWDQQRCKEMSIYPDTGFSDNLAADIGPTIKARGYKRVGIDNWYIFPAREYIRLQQEAPGTEFVPTHLMSEVRRVKSATELVIMRQAARVGVEAVAKALDAIEVGGSEFEISLMCEYDMRSGGDLHGSGESIGGCGAHTATGSFVPSRYNDRKMKAGEWVMLDVCPRVEGYCSDLSRHRVVGDESALDPMLKRLYATTVLMQQEVLKAAKPGISGRQLNSLARQVATAEGFGQYKIDLLGHGIGIDIHDIPDYYYDDSALQVGETITIEPCLLVPGVAGTRIEDTVLITESGVEILTDSWKGLTPNH